MFTINFSKQASKFLKNCNIELRERILAKIELLKEESVPHNAVRIVGEDKTFRLRIGDYRVMYEISWGRNDILIAMIDKRSKIYQS